MLLDQLGAIFHNNSVWLAEPAKFFFHMKFLTAFLVIVTMASTSTHLVNYLYAMITNFFLYHTLGRGLNISSPPLREWPRCRDASQFFWWLPRYESEPLATVATHYKVYEVFFYGPTSNMVSTYSLVNFRQKILCYIFSQEF